MRGILSAKCCRIPANYVLTIRMSCAVVTALCYSSLPCFGAETSFVHPSHFPCFVRSMRTANFLKATGKDGVSMVIALIVSGSHFYFIQLDRSCAPRRHICHDILLWCRSALMKLSFKSVILTCLQALQSTLLERSWQVRTQGMCSKRNCPDAMSDEMRGKHIKCAVVISKEMWAERLSMPLLP